MMLATFFALSLALQAPGAPGDVLDALRDGHPRLLWTADEQRQTEVLLKDDPVLGALRDRLVKQAEDVLGAPTVEYRLVGPRLLGQSREALGKVLTLATAFRLTEDARYRDRAVAELRAASAFPDWNPSHFLDVAEMTTAFAVGYDWLYPALSEEERAWIRAAIVGHGLEPGLRVYADSAWWMVRKPNNWNQVCNGGLALGALAVADAEPDLARRILRHAKATAPNGLLAYRPDGAYIEGPSYWAYGTTYTVLLIEALQDALGTDWGLLDAPGLADAGWFRIHTLAPTGGYYNYADAGVRARPSPALFWLAAAYDEPAFASYHRNRLRELLDSGSDDDFASRFFPLELVWYRPEGARDDLLAAPTGRLFRGPGDVWTARSAWDDPEAVFVGFKGGANRAPHAHLDIGSFVLEADGVRWAVDLGSDDYNLPGYWNDHEGGQRWTYFRLNSLSHNTLVLDGDVQRAESTSRAAVHADGPRRSHAVMDLTEAYRPRATAAYRGVALLDGRQVLVQDELTLAEGTETVRWAMATEADVHLDGASARLTQSGRALRVRVLDPPDARLEVLSADPGDPRQRANEGVGLLALRVRPEDRSVRIAVLLTPEGEPEVKVPDLKPLETWPNDQAALHPERAWPPGFEIVQISNPEDGRWQAAYVRASDRSGPRPLLLDLHSWSGDYTQRSALAERAAARGWHYVHPDFRGPNRNPDACCSPLALADLDAAIAYAMEHMKVDTAQIHVIGSSGGGYASLCYLMRGRREPATVSAWVPITDLEAWYEQTQSRGLRYHREILQCTESGDTLDVARARDRSPYWMRPPDGRLGRTQVRLYAGIRDGYDGSVPVTQSLKFYNKLLDEAAVSDAGARVSYEEMVHLLATRTPPVPVEGTVGDRAVIYRKAYGNFGLVLFDGAHELLPDAALGLIERAARGLPATTQPGEHP